MAMVKLDGFCLASLDAAQLPSATPGHFFLNLHSLVSARPATYGELVGYVLCDEVRQGYFVVISEAELSILFRMNERA